MDESGSLMKMAMGEWAYDTADISVMMGWEEPLSKPIYDAANLQWKNMFDSCLMAKITLSSTSVMG